MNGHDPVIGRREFLAAAALSSGALWCRPAFAQTPLTNSRPPICAFVKFVQSLSYPRLAETIKELGFDGIESTVRQGGHVRPERVEEELPQLVDALRQQDLEVTVMATDVVGVDEQSERVLRTASQLGIKRYRMGFYRYAPDRPILTQLEEIRPQLDELVALNRELGIQAVYQNHSGAKYLGATLWDLHQLIKDHPVDLMSSAFDIRHATIEAGLAWPVLYDVMKPHVGAIFVKDFDWVGPKAEHVPLGEGRVDKKFFPMALSGSFDGPLSLHVEYLKKAGVDENIAALRRDLRTLKSWL